MSKITTADIKNGFENNGYIGEEEIIVTVYLAVKLNKPLLITGAPGVGKTEIAKVLSNIFDTELIRLQCYEGLDENKALYEWNYQKQLLKIQMSADNNNSLEKDIFSYKYLLERPLLQAIRAEKRAVLLIDEIDKTDHEFEAFLYEVLSDFQVSIPELGTVQARQVPIVILTSNGDRELSDGLKRRCIFLYIDYPDIEKEVRILRTKVPDVGEKLSLQIARATNLLRSIDLAKAPSISETLDWARALIDLETKSLDESAVTNTLNLLLKDKSDQDKFKAELGVKKLVRESVAINER
ncbi:MoxR-like ATPase [Desulfitispora alkaliphila]|uniref:AAA family ATPase n=1 Tax=Desulfitispora alkaliphila TaxID=622674 RepID=UPI003D1FB8A3